MKILEYLKQKLGPGMPHDVESDLEIVIQILINSGITVREIKLYGSLDKGKWNREISDIDLYLLLDTNDERYSAFNRVVVGYGLDEDGGKYEIHEETQERRNLRNLVNNNSELVFSDRYDIHMVTLQDLKLMSKTFIMTTKAGRLLYPN